MSSPYDRTPYYFYIINLTTNHTNHMKTTSHIFIVQVTITKLYKNEHQ